MIMKLAAMLGVSKGVIYAGLIVLAIAAFFGAKALYDHSVISGHDAKVEASAAKADRKADEAATARAEADQQRRNYETDQLAKAVDNAPKDPNVSDDLERRIAFHKCLGLQQRARENGLQPPRCV